MATKIILPPAPKPANSFAELKQAISVWTRQAEQAVRQIAAVADAAGGFVSGISDAPSDGTTYGRLNGAWTAVISFSDAPSDGTIYGRQNGGWVAAPAGGGSGVTDILAVQVFS